MKIFRCNVFERWWGEDSVDVPWEHIEEFKVVDLPTEDLQRTPWQDISSWSFDMVSTEQIVWNGRSDEINATSIIKVVDGEDTMYYHYAGYQRQLQGLEGEAGFYRVQFIRDEWMSHQLFRLRNNIVAKTPMWFANKHMDRFIKDKQGNKYLDYVTQSYLRQLNTSIIPTFEIYKEKLNEIDFPDFDRTKLVLPCQISCQNASWGNIGEKSDDYEPNDGLVGSNETPVWPLYDFFNPAKSYSNEQVPHCNRVCSMNTHISIGPIDFYSYKTWFGYSKDFNYTKVCGTWEAIDGFYDLNNINNPDWNAPITENPTYKYVIVNNFNYTTSKSSSDVSNAKINEFVGERIQENNQVITTHEQYLPQLTLIVPWVSKYTTFVHSNIHDWDDKNFEQRIVDSFNELKRAIYDIYGVDIANQKTIMSVVSSNIKPSTLSYMLYKKNCPYNWYVEDDGSHCISINNLWKRSISFPPALKGKTWGSQFANFLVCDNSTANDLINELQSSTNGNNFFNILTNLQNEIKTNTQIPTIDKYEPILYTPVYLHHQLLITKTGQGTLGADILDLSKPLTNIGIKYLWLDNIHYKWDLGDNLNPHYELSSSEEELYFQDPRKYPFYDSSWDNYLSQNATSLNTSRSLASTSLWQQQITGAVGIGLSFRNPTALLQKSVNLSMAGVNYAKQVQQIDSQTANLINSPTSMTLPPFVGSLFEKPDSYFVTTTLTDLSKNTIGNYYRAYGYIVNMLLTADTIMNRQEFNYFKIDESVNMSQIIRESIHGNYPLTPFYAQKEFGNIYCDRLDRGIRLHIGGIHNVNSSSNYERDARQDLKLLLYRRDLIYVNLASPKYNKEIKYIDTNKIFWIRTIWDKNWQVNLKWLYYYTSIKYTNLSLPLYNLQEQYINTDNIDWISNLGDL